MNLPPSSQTGIFHCHSGGGLCPPEAEPGRLAAALQAGPSCHPGSLGLHPGTGARMPFQGLREGEFYFMGE